MLTCVIVLRPAAQISNIKQIDSLKRVLKTTSAGEDTNRVKTLCDIASASFVIDYNAGLVYGKEALTLAEKLKWRKGIGLANNAVGRNYWAKSDYLNALECHQKALTIFTQTGDIYNLIVSLKNIGSANYAIGDYDKALDYFQRALTLGSNSKDKAIRGMVYAEFGILAFMASTYASKIQNDKAIEVISMAITENEKAGDELEAAHCMPNLAAFQHLLGRHKEAEAVINKSLAVCTKYNDRLGMGKANEILGWFKEEGKNYDAAIKVYKNAVADFTYANDQGHLARNYASVGQIYLIIAYLPEGDAIAIGHTRKEALANAAVNFEKAVQIGLSINSLVSLQGYERGLADIYEMQGDNAKALAALKKYTVFHDSLTSTSTQKKFTEQLLKYEYDRQKDSLDYVNNLQQTQLQTLQQEKELGQLKLHQQWLYSITGLTVLGLLASLFIFRNRLQRIRLKNELEQEKSDKLLKEAEFNSRMNDITFSALRSQMNPHFIFNCLNSIKLYTEQNNSEAASEYLTKFSRLIRSILDSARADNITLDSELQLLKLYLEMEAMRFKEKLQYFINVEAGIDAEFIDMPPLIIQPYVENAIWHGLMHKQEGGKIKIDISMPQQGLLVISVEDNGVGRTKASALKSKNAVQNKSFGTRLTAERIALINEKYKTSAQIIITDLFDSNNNPCGTNVTIKLPVK